MDVQGRGNNDLKLYFPINDLNHFQKNGGETALKIIFNTDKYLY